MAIVVLPPTLRTRTEGTESLEIEGSTAAEVLAALERQQPELKGWILDETGRLRQHVALFVENRQIDPGQPIASDAELYIVQSISGGGPAAGDSLELLLGTRKGLFVLRGTRGGPAAITHRAFAGQTVDYACFDRRTGTYFAAMIHGQFGPHLYASDSLDGDWRETEGLSFPADADRGVERIWMIQPGAGEGELWAGVAPAALFRSADGGRSWELNRALWEHPTRSLWGAGLGGQALHSICPWPGEPARLAVGISAAGVWLTEDGGATWSRGSEGLVPRYIPEQVRAETLAHCVHKMLRARRDPETLYLQFHGGVYRSDDAGRTWTDIGTDSGLPGDFGFPLALDPARPDRAFVIPLAADADRVTPEGKLRVYRTSDRGRSWEALSAGLPQEDAYLTVLRQAFCDDGQSPLGLYFGTKSGEVFGSIDDGDSWSLLAEHLPSLLSVQMGR